MSERITRDPYLWHFVRRVLRLCAANRIRVWPGLIYWEDDLEMLVIDGWTFQWPPGVNYPLQAGFGLYVPSYMTLLRRAGYGGRKGRSALRRLRARYENRRAVVAPHKGNSHE